MAGLRWLPLESNPDVMNKYVHTLGVPGKFQFVDVWGLDPDLLMMVPKPVLAVLLLYPITPQSEKEIFGEEVKDADTYFIKQTIGNACGTMGLIHAILGNTGRIQLDASKHLSEFFEKTKSMTPEERGQYLETDTAFSEAHESSAQEGQTEAPARDKKIDLHFVAFIQRDGKVYEMGKYHVDSV
ncbi:Ubiquitin carboxyl-terminal hydrolase isozyme L3 [Lamellibrachia satsuma]|nr:Ubiquitin carboxyl-terminal hydrolase isozyme L3 [Lamellibrachia satsuma]